ncbi:MAG: hypothetical protein QXG03_06875 [Halalkalicoccus sp.]
MSPASFAERVAVAKALLEEAAREHEGIEASRMANLQEAIEFLRRLETSFPDDPTDE